MWAVRARPNATCKAWLGRPVLGCLLVFFLISGCTPVAGETQPAGTATPEGVAAPLLSTTVAPVTATQTGPEQTSPLPTPSHTAATAFQVEPSASPAKAGVQDSPLPLPSVTSPRDGLELVVLHTNDNWGETEPCG